MKKINRNFVRRSVGRKSSLARGAIYLILILTITSLVSAEGCCFDPSNGLCSQNAEESTCTSLEGEYYSSSSCNIDKCTKGCCSLGEEFLFRTTRTCELESRTYGFNYPENFQYVDEEACTALSISKVEGACLMGGEYEQECKVITYDQCPTGDFYEGVSCTEESLNTICEKTTDTICYDDSVYTEDSCGNPDELVESCDYSEGNICREKSLTEAFCEDLNCEDGHQNGDRWCVDTDYSEVGSRYFAQYCLNGEIYTEPCGDFRSESCVEGKCVINPFNDCIAAGNNSELCDTTHCEYNPVSGGEGFHKESVNALALGLCFPKIIGGQAFYPSSIPGLPSTGGSSSGETGGVCSGGNYQAELKFGYHGGNPSIAGFFGDSDNDWYYYPGDGSNYGSIGLTTLGRDIIKEPKYGVWQVNKYVSSDVNGIMKDTASNGGLTIDSGVLELLNLRCRALGDCDGKANWIGQSGGNPSLVGDGIPYRKPWSRDPTFTFNFECKPWAAPEGSDSCSECGEDGLPCSEYRCKALGKGCEYSEPSGAYNGFCVSSSDHTSSLISSTLNPTGLLPPFTPLEITIITDETTSCRFDLGDSGSIYEDMQYNLGEGWNTEHKVRLNLPGQEAGEDGFPEYELITEGGKEYEMFVRCIDTAGNWNLAAHLVKFQVMKTPDQIPPIIYSGSFEPSSGSPIKHNTSSKNIRFEVNEPVQCKWDENDKEFEEMKNDFDCDEDIKYESTEGYWCSGDLTDVGNDTIVGTKYYIRCKDQAWLDESNPDEDLYSRNVNDRSFEYVLKGSVPLEIIDLAPKKTVIKTSSDTSIEIETVTAGGGANGKAECRWRLNGECFGGGTSAYKLFSKTNSKIHADASTNLTEGSCNVEVSCNDGYGNEVEGDSSFDILIDDQSPKVTRAYHFAGSLVVLTNEEAECKYSTDPSINCNFDWNSPNTTLMSGASTNHETTWENYGRYYVKCRDYRLNTNPGCGIIVKTY